MLNQYKRRVKRIRNRIVVLALSAIMMGASTYAWFIGMRTVNVSSFDVKIASTNSLELSLDGQVWDTSISITQANFANTYDGNTNTWGGENGLIPVSSVGDMDASVSRMKLYEKASLTATPGGYRLLASRVKNDDQLKTGQNAEQAGYVAFDLFVKNFSGNKYITALNPADEEAIYLTTNSSVGVALDGADIGVEGTGIENSVRVAFAEIGRVVATTTDQGIITSITCEPDADGNPSVNGDVTGICRTAQIWEPNDTKHVDSAISWYDNSCVQRTGAGVTKADYNFVPDKVPCGDVAEGTAYPTYAVSNDIISGDNVDVYDGNKYNGYTGDIYNETTNPTGKLKAFPYFTDTMKGYTGVERPQFMTLSPNSITKVRIYIYIEGQDIDNYDFASIGKKISINFGFTKERFTPNDIQYNGPAIDPSEF